ncbi:MAG: ThuA domain-containing protein [Verrucomicrobiia bacterium]
MNALRVTVWGEFVHEKTNELVRKIYPEGMHVAIAGALQEEPGWEVRTATLEEPEHGLTEEVLAGTDVLVWWGHCAHEQVADHVVDRVQRRVLEGMGLVVLHSGHKSKVFRRLMGTSGDVIWREAGEKERLWVCNPGHPICQGLGAYFEIEHEEMYGEPFGIPSPDETLLISWFAGGEVFRSGATWKRGNGKIFYFRPGHETYPTYFQEEVRLVLRNGVRWARPEGGVWRGGSPNVPVEKAPEPIRAQGGSVH